jgi:hypothetical protein
MNELINKVNEINNLHQLAINSANEAIDYANQLGRLLRDIKIQLPHGSFTKWIEENLTVSPRQAQRYMAVTSGKDLNVSKLGYKNDKMSHLSSDDYLNRITMNPVWVPPEGYWFKCIYQNEFFVVVPDRRHPEDFHITKFQLLVGLTFDDLEIDWDKELHWTKQPVMASKVEGMLHIFGLDYPEKRDWRWIKREGLDAPMGIAEGYPITDEEVKNV